MKLSSLAFGLLSAFLASGLFAAAPDIVLDGGKFRLTIGSDAVAKSLVLTANGEECLDARERLPIFTVTQERPFNNEIKLANPNKRTTYWANSVRQEGSELIVGFECAPYQARVAVQKGDGYLRFTFKDFICVRELAYEGLKLDTPPACEFRVLQLPVKNRANVADWMNGVWDDKAATAVIAGDPYADATHDKRFGFQLLYVDLRPGVLFRGGSAALVCGAGKAAFLDSMDAFERDAGLPRGVQSRKSPLLNASIAWSARANPSNIDELVGIAKEGGFRMFMIYYTCFTKNAHKYGYGILHDYDWAETYTRGEADLDDILAKIKGAGMMAGLHVLQTHIGMNSSYVTPVADPRLNLKRRFTLAQALPAEGDVSEIRVFENPTDAPMYDRTRILKFGGELFSYEAYTTKEPYRFTGVKRGDHKTRNAAHPYGEIGGILDVSEYGGTSCYVDQNTDLPDEIGAKIAKIYDRGFGFFYFDGSEGVNPPCNINVSLAQYRVTSKVKTPPLFTEGAAKSHFGWHLQAGANAFDIFPPEIFKQMIVRFPQTEAPMMAKDMTRLDFGWWSLYLPGQDVVLKDRVPYEKVKTIGTQMDMWEFGTSRAAAWDCPATIMIGEHYKLHPRKKDLLTVMRRWEDVRAKGWLTPAMKAALKSPTQEHHLYLNEKGEYELCEIEMLPTPAKAPNARGFIFERQGKRVIAVWHTKGAAKLEIDLGKGAETLPLDDLHYFTTDLSREDAKKAYAAAVQVLAETHSVENRPGYNSWPMIQAIGNRLVCAYSRGTKHDVFEGVRGTWAKYSDDGGKTWSAPVCVADAPECGEVPIGKGLDSTGAMLLWVRCYGGPKNHHDLYRTTDGKAFTRLASLSLDPMPVQITDVFAVPGKGLVAHWFAGNYSDKDAQKSWGELESGDDGRTWTQRTIAKDLGKFDWPTEPSVVYLGDGRLLSIARSERSPKDEPCQFQLQSTDNGSTWTCRKTNITDVMCSTPSLIYDAKKGIVYNYYYERGTTDLKRRVAKLAAIWNHPTEWPSPELVTKGSDSPWDSGNANATAIGTTHYTAYYTGHHPNTEVRVAAIPNR